MRHIGKVVAAFFLLVLTAAPVFAGTAAVGEKPLTFIQFSDLSENRGLHGRSIESKYVEYRRGRIPVTTLETSRMR